MPFISHLYYQLSLQAKDGYTKLTSLRKAQLQIENTQKVLNEKEHEQLYAKVQMNPMALLKGFDLISFPTIINHNNKNG